MRPFDTVTIKDDLPEFGIRAGTEGAIVEELANGEAFIIEFFDADGNTIDVVTVSPEQITVIVADFFEGEKVALTETLREHHLVRGQVGIIEKRNGDGMYTVTFADTNGTIYARIALHAKYLMLLRWQPITTQRSA